MRVVISGATGFIGSALVDQLRADGDEPIALTRDPEKANRRLPALAGAVAWDPLASPAPPEALEGADAVVHLAGESVAGLWTAAKRAAILDSRVTGTRHLVAGLRALGSRPPVLVSASAIGYYGDRGEERLVESSPPGSDFLATVCREWEAAATEATVLGMRVVTPRIGLVLGRDGGVLQAMLPSFRLGLGARLGSGQQWWAWIQRQDLVALIRYAIASDLAGPVNATAPGVVRQWDFTRSVARAIRRPAFLQVPALVLRAVLGEFSAELLSSKRVLSDRAEASGLGFQFPLLTDALAASLAGSETPEG